MIRRHAGDAGAAQPRPTTSRPQKTRTSIESLATNQPADTAATFPRLNGARCVGEMADVAGMSTRAASVAAKRASVDLSVFQK